MGQMTAVHDGHVFDAAGELIHAGSVALKQPGWPTDPALRVWEDEVYQGSGGGSGDGGLVPFGRATVETCGKSLPARA